MDGRDHWSEKQSDNPSAYYMHACFTLELFRLSIVHCSPRHGRTYVFILIAIHHESWSTGTFSSPHICLAVCHSVIPCRHSIRSEHYSACLLIYIRTRTGNKIVPCFDRTVLEISLWHTSTLCAHSVRFEPTPTSFVIAYWRWHSRKRPEYIADRIAANTRRGKSTREAFNQFDIFVVRCESRPIARSPCIPEKGAENI